MTGQESDLSLSGSNGGARYPTRRRVALWRPACSIWTISETTSAIANVFIVPVQITLDQGPAGFPSAVISDATRTHTVNIRDRMRNSQQKSPWLPSYR